MHTFSNGGAIQLTTLGSMIRKRAEAEAAATRSSYVTPLPARSIVIDSAPGTTGLRGLLRAFTAGIKSTILKLPIYLVLTLIWAVIRAYTAIVRPPPAHIDKLNLDLYDPTILPRTAKRLYIYSKNDELIEYQNIEKNIENARKAGVEVETLKFDKSPHVAHARTDGHR